jgi:hypothetical protein
MDRSGGQGADFKEASNRRATAIAGPPGPELGRRTNAGPSRLYTPAPDYIYPRGHGRVKVRSMMRRQLLRSTRGGVVLDLVVAFGLILIAAFAFEWLGISFATLLQAAGRFFGL